MFLQFLVLFALIILVLHINYRYCREGMLIGRIKGPKQMFFFGNVWDICVSPEKLFTNQMKWHKIYGDIWRLCGFHYRAIYIYKPEDIETVLSTTRHNDKTFPYMFLKQWLNEGLLISNGQKWQQRRKLLTPAFHFAILKNFFVTMCDHTEDLMKYIGAEVGKDKTNLIPLISKQTLRVICETSMGIGIKDREQITMNKYFDALNVIGECVFRRIARLWLYIDFVYNFTSIARAERDALKDLHGFTTNVIKERRKLRDNYSVSDYHAAGNTYGNKSKMAMLDILLDEERKGNIDEAGIREEVDTFIFEGHDTTSKALSYMIMRIANEPEIQNLLHEELHKVLGDSEKMPNLDELNQMKYLECCIKESLRLYPSVPSIVRNISQDTDIGEYRIPKNTFCIMHVYDIHRNPEVFPEPEKFVPERFLPENKSKIHPYAYIPFSAGPRNCIGQKFAMIEMKTVMANLLWRYKLEPVTRPEDIVFKSDLILATTHPIYVRFCNRKI